MRATHQHTSGGFTLIEMVIALTISAVLVGFAAFFVSAPMDAYVDHAARKDLTESSENIGRVMVNDLRSALPNSVRVRNVGNQSVVELLRVGGMGYYQPQGVLPADVTLTEQDRGLDFAIEDVRFSTFGTIAPNVVAVPLPAPGTLIGGYLATGNMGADSGATRNAYQIDGPGTKVITPLGMQIRLNRAANGEETISLNPGFTFTNPMPVALTRMYWVEGPVSYICNSNANSRSLRRFAKYTISQDPPANESAAQFSAAETTNTLLADNVSSCRFFCFPNENVCSGTIVIEISVDRVLPDATEVIRVFEQVPLDNNK
jgi:MSHA biogenesis protein MshO